jgi:nitrite reductase/ring-hydroxylating ferredoxin subunit
MRYKVASVGDILPGGIMAVQASDVEILLCNLDGKYYALEKRCGHMSAPLELGTLNGYVLTCPMHSAQFSVVTGEAINAAILRERPPPKLDGPSAVPGYLSKLMDKVKTLDLRTFPVSVEGDSIFIDV